MLEDLIGLDRGIERLLTGLGRGRSGLPFERRREIVYFIVTFYRSNGARNLCFKHAQPRDRGRCPTRGENEIQPDIFPGHAREGVASLQSRLAFGSRQSIANMMDAQKF